MLLAWKIREDNVLLGLVQKTISLAELIQAYSESGSIPDGANSPERNRTLRP